MEKKDQYSQEHCANLDLNKTISETYLEQTGIVTVWKFVSKSLDQDSVHPALHDCWHAEPIQGKLGKK